jgi:hypothetical protein
MLNGKNILLLLYIEDRLIMGESAKDWVRAHIEKQYDKVIMAEVDRLL